MSRDIETSARPILQLRAYQDTDHDAVWELHNIALGRDEAHPGNGPWDDDLHSIGEVYCEPGGCFIIGTLAGEIVAMGALRRLGETGAEIKRMRVHPNYQRRGFGQRILDELENRAQRLGIFHLRLDTTTLQTGAIAFYIKNGYAESGRQIISKFTVILFEKNLT